MATAHPHPFVIVCDLRTGSTLLSTSLDRHPQIRCRGELLHSDDHADNGFDGIDRHALTGRQLVAAALTPPPGCAAGFRAMVHQPDTEARPQWRDAWTTLATWPRLRVIVLHRKDVLAQYASYRVAERIGAFHPPPDADVLEPDRRPIVHVDEQALNEWAQQRSELYRRRCTELAGHARLETTYEALARHWDTEMLRIQRFLGVVPQHLTQGKAKQERRPLSQVVSNYARLRQRSDRTPS
jgi:LPS sulfotransferase NodH